MRLGPRMPQLLWWETLILVGLTGYVTDSLKCAALCFAAILFLFVRSFWFSIIFGMIFSLGFSIFIGYFIWSLCFDVFWTLFGSGFVFVICLLGNGINFI